MVSSARRFSTTFSGRSNPRRIHVGSWLTFLFENHDTVRFQIQEMIRVEQMVKEADIEHEIDTYNELLGSEGQLGATLLIEIDDVEKRQELLTRWTDLPAHLYVELEDGERVYAGYDNRQVGEERLSSVQYLAFDTKGRVPVAIGADHESLTEETGTDRGAARSIACGLGVGGIHETPLFSAFCFFLLSTGAVFAAQSDEKAVAVADEVMEALGGQSAWDNTRCLTWSFFGRRTHVWDKFTGGSALRERGYAGPDELGTRRKAGLEERRGGE